MCNQVQNRFINKVDSSEAFCMQYVECSRITMPYDLFSLQVYGGMNGKLRYEDLLS